MVSDSSYHEIRQEAHRLVDAVMNHFETLEQKDSLRVLPQEKEADVLQYPIGQKGTSLPELMDFLHRDVFQYMAHLNHPRFYAFIPGPMLPISWLGEVITRGYNAHAGSWLEASGPTLLERQLISYMGKELGYGEDAGGIFVSGGSHANLTAVSLARMERLDPKYLSRATVYVSDQTHSSVDKSFKVIGLDPDNIRKVATAEDYTINTHHLKVQVEEDKRNGFTPFLIVGNAGTTNTGSIDDFVALRDIADQYSMWLHADGAYGAAIAFGKEYKHLLKDLHHADSISLDPHKWLFQTIGSGIVFVKKRSQMLDHFINNPDYLKDAESDFEHPNMWDYGLELTRSARVIKLWLTFQYLGAEEMARLIDRGCALCDYAQSRLEMIDNIEILSPSQLAIVAFRFTDAHLSEEKIDLWNKAIAKKMKEDGKATVLTSKLKNKVVLRMVTISPWCTEKDIDLTLNLLEGFAQEVFQNDKFESVSPHS